MRRPLLIIFVLAIFITYIYIENLPVDKSYNNEIVKIQGTVKNKIEKEKYNEYKINEFLVRDYTKNNKINIGQIIKIEGKYKNLDQMKFEEFDYGRYIKSTGIKGIIYIKTYEIIDKDMLYTFIGEIKVCIRHVVRYLYKSNSDFINSILIGDKGYLSEEEKDMFSKTGTSHVIAISGLHIGILCSFIVLIIRKVNKFYKLILLSIVMILYCIMVGTPPSIIRSITFTIILYLAVFMDKKRDSISTLSLIGIFLIANNPYIIYNVSFQLSFLATLSIIYFYGYINDIIKVSIVSLTISANILTLPIIYYNFKGIPITSIISNIIVVPFMGVIMYGSILSIILFKINIYMAKVIAYFNRIIIDNIYFLLEKLSELEFAYIRIDNPNKYYVIIYYIAVFLYMIYKELKVMKEQENELQGYYKEY